MHFIEGRNSFHMQINDLLRDRSNKTLRNFEIIKILKFDERLLIHNN